MDKNLLLIFRQAPFANSSNREALDIALGCSAFDIPVSLVFLGDAVLQLIPSQQGADIGQKDLLKTLSALQMYDIKDFYLLDSDVDRYQVTPKELALNCNVVSATQLAHLIRQFDTVINL